MDASTLPSLQTFGLRQRCFMDNAYNLLSKDEYIY
jgi:hypothetical protein